MIQGSVTDYLRMRFSPFKRELKVLPSGLLVTEI